MTIRAIRFKRDTKPGDVMDSRGCIHVAPLPGDEGDPYGVEFGEVFVTKEQAREAAEFGWVEQPAAANDPPSLVRIIRHEP